MRGQFQITDICKIAEIIPVYIDANRYAWVFVFVFVFPYKWMDGMDGGVYDVARGMLKLKNAFAW